MSEKLLILYKTIVERFIGNTKTVVVYCISACSGLSGDLAEYVCHECSGASGHADVQSWSAQCNGKASI